MVSHGTHLVKNHESQARTNESQFKKQWVLNWKYLDLYVTKQLIWLQNSVLQFTEITIYSFYCKAQQRLKEICVVKQKPREQPHKSHEQYILNKGHLMVNRSIFASYAEAYELFCFPGDFYQSGTPNTEVTKSLQGDYGIEGQFASEWRDWRTLKGMLVRDLIEKRNVEKTLFLIGTTTAKHPHGLQWYGNLQSLVRCIEIVVDMRVSAHTGPRQANAIRTLTGCWLTARRVVALKLKILIQVVLLGPDWENTLKIRSGCCQTAS